MKLLLTSGGVTNDSIRAALVDLLGKPVEEATALGNPAYALDEQSAVLVDGDRVEVVSEGEWRHFAQTPSHGRLAACRSPEDSTAAAPSRSAVGCHPGSTTPARRGRC